MKELYAFAILNDHFCKQNAFFITRALIGRINGERDKARGFISELRFGLKFLSPVIKGAIDYIVLLTKINSSNTRPLIFLKQV